MKFVIIAAVTLLIIAFIISGCSRLAGGLSNKKAASNLETYLEREYGGELTFSNLNRFFNAATMNPNIFTVLIYNKNIPEIEFYTHINVKTILEDDSLPMYGSEKKTISDLYNEALNRYTIRQAIITDFKNDIPEIIFSTDIITLDFKKKLVAAELPKILENFVAKMNQSFEELFSGYEWSLLIKTDKHTEGFMEIPLDIDDDKWHLKPFMLSEKVNNFNILKTKVEETLQAKLNASYTNYKISDYKKIYLDKSSLSKGAWVHYLNDKRVVNVENGPWKNPQKAIYISYFDLDSLFIYRGLMLTEESDKASFEEEATQIAKALKNEGIIIN